MGYLSVFEKVQGDLYILQFVEPHAPLLSWLKKMWGHKTSGGENNTVGINVKQRARPYDWGQVFHTFFFLFFFFYELQIGSTNLYSHGLGGDNGQWILGVTQILLCCDQSTIWFTSLLCLWFGF